jgi:hypothetical protein
MTLSLTLLLHHLGTLPPATYAGALAVAANCSWPLLRQRRTILALQATGASLFGLHYLMLGAPTAAAMCAAGVVQGVSAATLSSRRLRLGLFGASIAAGLAMTAATFAGISSALAQCGALLSATGRLQRVPQAIRWCFLASEAFWVSHNLLVGSTWGLTSDTLAVTTLLIGLWRGRQPAVARAALAPARA